MGSRGHVVVVDGDPGLVGRAVDRLAELEARWSRFRPDSELNRVNAAGGAPCLVSTDTAVLVAALVDAWRRTGGRFDPTVHDALGALGYDTTFAAVGGRGHLAGGPDIPGCSAVHVRADRGLVHLPAGVRLDPGGLGKGLAADLVATELLAAGAAGVLVNVGGDLRAAGAAPSEEGWLVEIEAPDRHDGIALVRLAAGGVATSTSARRRWTTADGDIVHHLLDPSTGRPGGTGWSQVTAIAGTAAAAEVAAKVAFLDGSLPAGAEAVVAVAETGTVEVLGDARFVELPSSSSLGHVGL
jgi:thiamine biosynthesis lipoprotein